MGTAGIEEMKVILEEIGEMRGYLEETEEMRGYLEGTGGIEVFEGTGGIEVFGGKKVFVIQGGTAGKKDFPQGTVGKKGVNSEVEKAMPIPGETGVLKVSRIENLEDSEMAYSTEIVLDLGIPLNPQPQCLRHLVAVLDCQEHLSAVVGLSGRREQ